MRKCKPMPLTFVLIVIVLLCRMGVAQTDVRDLSGTWRFQLDPRDQGNEQRWFNRALDHALELPGMLTAQGYGDPVSLDTAWTGNIRDEWFQDPYYRQYQDPCDFKMPFWLQPDRHYVGAAWYQRELEIPVDWQEKRVVLFLERPHWETTVWLDGRRVGRQHYLGAPHEHVLGYRLAPGRHRLTLRVDNRMIVKVGLNSHSVSDHTQGNWNGVAGRLELRATDPVWIEDLRVFSSVDGELRVTAALGNLSGGALQDVTLTANRPRGEGARDSRRTLQSVSWQGTQDAGRIYSCTLQTDCSPWDEFAPNLYPLHVTVTAVVDGQTYTDHRVTTVGLREVGTRGSRITINHKPVFLRGTLECCIFPRTGHPPTDVGSWKRIIAICKAHGLNHMRFHSWCPPEAAFVAADELGFYLQVECSSWANQGTTVGDGRPVDSWLYEEAAAILKAYGNHPSFIMMAYGNEPGGKNQVGYLKAFIERWRREDPRRLYTSGAGWPLMPESDFHVAPQPRIQAWGQGLKSIINAQAPRSDYDWSEFVRQHANTPVVSHEIGQWCVYPNLAERAKYTGPLKARNFDVFAEQLERHGMAHQARDFLRASGKLQTLCYKADIEAALRTPGFGGFQLLDLHDFPGQGTALVGVLDPFWDEKGYVTAAQYRRFSGPVVPLARLRRRIFETGDRLQVPVQLSHFGAQDLQGVTPAWTLRDAGGDILRSGTFARQDIPRGSLADIGTVRTELTGLDRAARLRLEVLLPETDAVNAWDLWVYPQHADTVADERILITRALDEKTSRHLEQGGKVLWLPPSHTLRDDPTYPLKMGFSSIFWNTVWTGRQAPHTLGVLCDPQHPALHSFPTEFHSNWQWWDLMHDGRPFILTEFRDLQPVVQVIDDWVTARKLALVFEARVGEGRLLACSSDLVTDLDQRPVARQLRASLLAYMTSASFAPTVTMAESRLKALVREPSEMERLRAEVTADSHQENFEPQQALDGDPRTIWHTAWQPLVPYPHHLTLDLQKTQQITGLTYLPRADQQNGRIADYEIYLSLDGTHWGSPRARGTWPDTAQQKTVRFERPLEARYLKLKALSEVSGQDYASAAEIGVLVE